MTARGGAAWLVAMAAKHKRALKGAGLLFGVLLGVLCGALWLAQANVAPPADAQPAPVAVAGVLPASAALGGVARSAPASASHRAGEPSGSARAELAQRMKADWCGFGAAEAERQSAEVTDRAVAQSGTVGPEAVAELGTTVGAEVREEAVAQVRRRWSEALMKRGDVRSMALADFLGFGADAGSDAAAQARARLQARARTSSDPMVTALALQRPCAAGACVNIEDSQWSRLEPANLRAWVPLLLHPGAGAGYVLERLGAEARFVRTYQLETTDALLSLPQTETPGLQAEAEVALIHGLAAAWQVPSVRLVLDACRSGAADASVAARCEALADLLWQGGDLMDRAQSLGLVRALAPSRQGLRARWESRARAYEAAQVWMAGASERLMQAGAAGQGLLSGCVALGNERQRMRAAQGYTEWERVRAEMQAAGVDEAALSARWREGAGRSLLDPIPAALSPAPRR